MKSQTLSLKTSVIGTLAYSSVFYFPLTTAELKSRLIGQFPNLTDKELTQLRLQCPHISFRNGFWFLKGEEKNLILRKKKAFYSRLKQTELQLLRNFLARIPTISSAYITGALAVENVESFNDDIDVLIICRPHTLWLTRLIVVCYTSLIGKYRAHGSRGAFGWCFNLWLDQKHTEMPNKNRSLYTAYEVIQARHILGKGNELLDSNTWIKEYINYSEKAIKSNTYEDLTKPETKRVSFLTLLLEKEAFMLQRAYMSSRKTNEQVTEGYAFFHPRNTQQLVFRQWKNKLDQIGLSAVEKGMLQSYFVKTKIYE